MLRHTLTLCGLLSTVGVLAACTADEPASGSSDAGAGGRGGGGGADDGPDDAAVDTPTPFPADRLVEVELTLPADDWAALVADPSPDREYLAQVVWDGVALADVSLRTKGAQAVFTLAAAGSDRFSFKLDLNDTVEDQTLHGRKKLNLHHEFRDPTRLREVLAHEAFAALGVKTPAAALAHVRMNGVSLGIYTAVEEVDGAFLDARFADDEGTLYQLDAPAGTLARSTTEPPTYPGLDVERGEPASPAPPDFLALVEALAAPSPARVEAVLDLDAALRFLAAQAALVHLDGYLGEDAGGFFLYGQAGVFTPIPWGLGEAFALEACACAAPALVDLPAFAPTCGPVAERPLVAALLSEPTWRERYLHHLAFAAERLAALSPRIEALAARIRPVVEADTGAWYAPADFEWALTEDLTRPDAPDDPPIPGLARFVAARAESLRAQLGVATYPAPEAEAGACPEAPNDPNDPAVDD
jgi:hypothetical protein